MVTLKVELRVPGEGEPAGWIWAALGAPPQVLGPFPGSSPPRARPLQREPCPQSRAGLRGERTPEAGPRQTRWEAKGRLRAAQGAGRAWVSCPGFGGAQCRRPDTCGRGGTGGPPSPSPRPLRPSLQALKDSPPMTPGVSTANWSSPKTASVP